MEVFTIEEHGNSEAAALTCYDHLTVAHGGVNDPDDPLYCPKIFVEAAVG
jgi:hypothetical protein